MKTEDTADPTLRAAFEAWVISPPFERSVGRFSELSVWPGRYTDAAIWRIDHVIDKRAEPFHLTDGA